MPRHEATRSPLATFAAAAACCGAALCSGLANAGGLPAEPDFRIWTPSNTGIPGFTHMEIVAFGPDDRLWVGARDFFWQQGGVAALDFATEQWTTYSSAETPLEQFNNAIDFAADGSAWIACDDSVVHLHADGRTMISHNPGSVVGPFGDISISPNGHVWVSNSGEVDLGGGLFEYDGVAWTKHEEPWMTTWTGFGFAPALNVMARSNGDVWVTFLSSPSRVGRYRNGAWTVYESSQAPRIIDYAEDVDGTLYGVSAFATYRYNDVTEAWQQIGASGASEIALDPSGDALYIQSDLETVLRYDGASWSTFATFPGWVGGFGVAPNGDVWIGAETWRTHYDLHHYDANGQLLRVYNRANTGMLDFFNPRMHLDRDGVMWFCDGEYGATRREPAEHGLNWRNFGIYNGQEEVYPFWTFPVGMPWWQTPGADFWTESVDQVYHDTQGNFWLRGPNIIARSAGDDLSQWTIWPPGHQGFPASCDSVGEDAQGNIWVGTAFVLMRLVGSTWTEVRIGIPGQFAPIDLVQGEDGELYAVRVSTVYRVSGSTITTVFSAPDDFGAVTDVEVDAQGHLWIGTPNGLIFWDGTAMTVYTPDNSEMTDLAVIDITIRPSDGLVAVATSEQQKVPYTGGVALFDPETGEWIGYDHGSSFVPFYAVGPLEFDAEGHLWIGVLNFGAVQVFIGERSGSECPADIALDDGIVDGNDLAVVLGAWGPCLDCVADFNDDGVVDGIDLAVVLGAWGPCGR